MLRPGVPGQLARLKFQTLATLPSKYGVACANGTSDAGGFGTAGGVGVGGNFVFSGSACDADAIGNLSFQVRSFLIFVAAI